MKTKSEQLEVCRTCAGQDCRDCSGNEYVLAIKRSLVGFSNLKPTMSLNSHHGKAPCHTCRDKSAGDRRTITATDDKTGKSVDFDVCIACYGYLMT